MSSTFSQPRLTHARTKWLRHSWRVLSLPLLFFFTLPLLALLLRVSPDRLIANLNQQQVQQAIQLSLQTTLLATLITIIFGTPVAYLLAQRRFRFYRLIDTLTDLPTVLPPGVAGVALLITFGRRGILGGALHDLGIDIAFTSTAVVMAQVFVAASFYIRTASLGFANVDLEIRQAAAIDGASSWQAFRYIVVPLSARAIISGSVMSWTRALGEFGATIIFAGNFPGRTQTMPLAIYIGFELDLDVALTLSAILVGFAFVALMIVKSLVQRDALEHG